MNKKINKPKCIFPILYSSYENSNSTFSKKVLEEKDNSSNPIRDEPIDELSLGGRGEIFEMIVFELEGLLQCWVRCDEADLRFQISVNRSFSLQRKFIIKIFPSRLINSHSSTIQRQSCRAVNSRKEYTKVPWRDMSTTFFHIRAKRCDFPVCVF